VLRTLGISSKSAIYTVQSFIYNCKFLISRFLAYKLLYYHIHGRRKTFQPRRDRIVLSNCMGKLPYDCCSHFFVYLCVFSYDTVNFFCFSERHQEIFPECRRKVRWFSAEQESLTVVINIDHHVCTVAAGGNVLDRFDTTFIQH
jgi:hypothetical protein